jgi:hypothetical protein
MTCFQRALEMQQDARGGEMDFWGRAHTFRHDGKNKSPAKPGF